MELTWWGEEERGKERWKRWRRYTGTANQEWGAPDQQVPGMERPTRLKGSAVVVLPFRCSSNVRMQHLAARMALRKNITPYDDNENLCHLNDPFDFKRII
ncbi:hypothetical protein V1478_010926 [Vespula squamosa]|uniref:Uncharacterized protein n=1 Tax=Vespula squamosa TaxID=30214 RepID=A0ABD2AFQ7_VESSQ